MTIAFVLTRMPALMISEGQARALLSDCEAANGGPLERLREKLAGDDRTLAALWELITLHTSLQLGQRVIHEPGDGLPDVLVEVPQLGRFWIEAAHVDWPPRKEAVVTKKFLDWIAKEFSREGVTVGDYDVRVEPSAISQRVEIPFEHEWPQLRRIDQWRSFVEQLRARSDSATTGQLPRPFGLSLTFTRVASDRHFRFLHQRTIQPAHPIAGHPIYGAIKSKALQARRRRTDEPLVLCLGSSLSTTLHGVLVNGAPCLRTVVESALSHTRRWPNPHQPDKPHDTAKNVYRVSGASRISGVLVASIENSTDVRRHENGAREARVRFIHNDEARHPLSEAQASAIEALDFNTFPYGPQWETWDSPSAARWNDRDRLATRTEPGGTSMTSTRDGVLELRIATSDLTQILAGGVRGSHLSQQLQRFMVGMGTSTLPDLDHAEVIPGNPKLREPSVLKLTFRPGAAPIVQALGKGKL